MPYGSHWEWRGFGGVSSQFVQCYSSLKVKYELHVIKDYYIWIPGLNVNTKFREGAESGLKFKRQGKKDNNFEVWTENKNELFNFPLTQKAWKTLLEMLESSGLSLPDTPPSSFTRQKIEHWLKQAGCQLVKIHKTRESRIWHGEQGSILVEWACISKPQSIISIGLENYTGNEEDQTSAKDKDILKSALKELGLSKEPLRPMNYLDALRVWTKGNKI